jgi:hypothetical protein
MVDGSGYNQRAVSEMNGDAPFEAVVCGRCSTACSTEDNFCRHCGLALQDVRLPAVKEGLLPAISRPALPAVVVKGATVIAAGAIAEMLVRRAVSRAFGRGKAERLPARASKNGKSDVAIPEGTLESETLLMRRVRVRR